MYLQYSSFYPKYDRYLVLNTNLFKQYISKSYTLKNTCHKKNDEFSPQKINTLAFIQNTTDIWYKVPNQNR